MTASVRAALFDLGGVVLESPLRFIGDYEQRFGASERLIARLVGGYGNDQGPWQALERGELLLEAFCDRFDEEIRAVGGSISTLHLMREMNRHTVVRPEMIGAIRRLRAAGFKVGALTNNWRTDDEQDERLASLKAEFHVFVESWREGMRKPEARFFELACARMGVTPQEIVFLDDIGTNLKAARVLGMTTIKVGDPAPALRELAEVVGFSLESVAAP